MANQINRLPVNDQTQAVLNKYGITAPRKISNIQNIQNKTETDIKIVQPDIRVTPPQININPVEQIAQRYRQWVSSAYDRQKQTAEKQKEDLREKEYALSKNISKIYQKIEELTTQIVDKGKKFKQRMDSSMTPLVAVYVSTILPIIWKPLMNRLDSLEKGFRYLFFGEVPPGEEEDNNSFSFVKSIREFLGMDDKEGKGLFGGIGDIISEGVQKLIDYLKIQRDDRVQAAQEVLKKPAPGFNWDIKESFSENFQYLGDIITAILGGSKAMSNRQNKRETIENIANDNTSNRSGKWIKNAIKEKTPAASFYLSEQAVKYLNNPNAKEYNKLEFLLNELESISDRLNEVYVSQDFVEFFLGKEKLKELEKSGDLEKTNIKVISDKKNKDYNLGYLSETPRKNGLWKNKDQEIKGHTPYAYKSYKITPKVLQMIGENKERFIKERHEAIHGIDISQKAKDIRHTPNAFDSISKRTQRKISDLNTSEKYQHFNNFGTVNYSIPSEKKPMKVVSPRSTISSVTRIGSVPVTSNTNPSEIINQAKKDIGKITYKYGGKNYNNTDCSGYISRLYNKFGVTVPAGTVNIVEDANKGKKAVWVDKTEDTNSVYRRGKYIPNWNKLRPGDIMVWSRYGSDFVKNRAKQNYAGHVSLYTGEVDEKGKPIILGNPGPEGAKGIKRERQDLSSYLGAIRYDLALSNIPSVRSGSQEDGEKPVQNTFNPLPDLVEPTKVTAVEPVFAERSIPVSKRLHTENVQVSSRNITQEVNNTEKQKEEILNNMQASLSNLETSISLKEAHAKAMIDKTT